MVTLFRFLYNVVELVAQNAHWLIGKDSFASFLSSCAQEFQILGHPYIRFFKRALNAQLIMYFADPGAESWEVSSFVSNRCQSAVNFAFTFWKSCISSHSSCERRHQVLLTVHYCGQASSIVLRCSICCHLVFLDSIHFLIEIQQLFLLLYFQKVANALGIRHYMLCWLRLLLRSLRNADAELGFFLAWPLADVVEALICDVVTFEIFS